MITRSSISIDKKLLVSNAPFIAIYYVVNKLAYLYNITSGNGTRKMQALVLKTGEAFDPIWPSFNGKDIMIALLVVGVLKLYMLEKKNNRKKLRIGEEFGSARWGTKEDIKPFMSAKEKDNIILTKTERISLKRVKDYRCNINKNILVIGSSGSGKTRGFVKPNLMQEHSSYVVTDPKGTIVEECGKMLKNDGYKVLIFNTIDFEKSHHYNPFMYISKKHPEKDILKLVNTLMINTKGEGKSGDDFWTKAEALLYTAYIAYIYFELPKEDRNFITLLAMIDESQTSEEDENFQNPVDIMFENLAKRKPLSFAVRQYKKYKLAAGKTAKSILISCAARLAPFDIEELREITRYDELELDLLGDRKTALFVIISDTDSTFNFIVAMMYTQLFNTLCERADNRYHGKLPIHVRCLLDEVANIGQITNLEKLIATIRSREISAALILQTKSQLKSIYKENAETIEGNCDTLLFLGGREKSTIKDMSEMLGKETIDLMNTSESKGQSDSNSVSYSKGGMNLMTEDAIAVMDGGKCILSVKGARPFFSDKYNIEEHPNYKKLADYDNKNYFDIKKHVRTSFRDGTKLVLSENVIVSVSDVGEI